MAVLSPSIRISLDTCATFVSTWVSSDKGGIKLTSRSSYMHILASPAGVHALPSASASESTMTSTPKATQAYAGRVVRRSRALVSFRKHAAGKMYASAVAEIPPVISSVTPRSHVMSDTVVS